MDTEERTGQQGGILNIPIVSRYAPAVRMNMRMWIETLADGTLQLQYEQIVDFEFHFGTDGGIIPLAAYSGEYLAQEMLSQARNVATERINLFRSAGLVVSP